MSPRSASSGPSDTRGPGGLRSLNDAQIGQDFVFGRILVTVFLVHGYRAAPFRGPVFLAVTVVPCRRDIYADTHYIREYENEDSF